VGESERGVREIFHKARQAAPCIIFFDEIDALVPSRGGGTSDSHVTERVIGQFLAEMDGIEELKSILILGATNRADILDPALLRPGRFDVVVEIPLPDHDARAAIFAIGLRDRPLADGIMIDSLAERTAGFTGADIQAVCDLAALAAIRAVREAMDLGETNRVRITADHLALALTQCRARRGPLVTPS
jgi:transitional endoplasmic reticulum ATPase